MPTQTYGTPEVLGDYHTDYFGGTHEPKIALIDFGRRDLVWTQGHYGYPHFPPLKDVGGDFMVCYNTTKCTTADIGDIQGGNAYAEHHYRGTMAAQVTDLLADSLHIDAAAYGAEAFAKMKPDKPDMSGAVSIYELKDVPGMLKQRFLLNGLHEIGDYYLASKFGWNQLLADTRNFVLTHMAAQDRLNQLLRDEGKSIRRSARIAASESYSPPNIGIGNYQQPTFVTYFYANGGSYRTQVVQEDIIWASARFRYFLPPGPRDVHWSRRMKGRIFGLNPTPKQVYNVIPWSWLFDWFTGLGNVLDNTTVNVVDRLAAETFYVMRHTEKRVVADLTSTYFKSGSLEQVTANTSCTIRSGCKSRLKGDPFGFGIRQEDLSNSQLAILGALGLSRLR